MLDDSTMEKKSNGRSSLQSSKGICADSKYKQDGTSKFPRGPRKREGASRSDGARKPNPQKNKMLNDKRPRARGVVNFTRDGSEVVEGDLLDAGIAIKTGSKKVNLNHLLNFTFAKREFNSENYRGGTYNFNHGRIRFPKYNKELFLQANCQFIVQEGGNYAIHMADPDILVDWPLVEQVLLPCYEVPSCPICLYPATAAKITRCGHIYCWSCILHYLSLSDKTWHKCPICYEAVHKNDLKSVISLAKLAPKMGERITLSLVRREKGSLFAIPVAKWKNCPTKPLSITDDYETTCFQKLLVANKEEVSGIIMRENNELLFQLSIDENNPEICFIESAIESLKERKESMNSNKDANANDTLTIEDELTGEPTDDATDLLDLKCTVGDGKEEIVLEEDDILGDMFQEEIEAGNINLNSLEQKNCYYFYQASDGQHIYMNSLNVRMLIEEYGSLDNCPPTITAEIVDLDSATMTEALRKRLRYLQHLPLTCQFQMVELHFEPPLISPTTLASFKPEIEKRRRARTRKAREERRRERHIELEENKKIGKFPSARYKLDSMQHFPIYKSTSTDDDPPQSCDTPPLSLETVPIQETPPPTPESLENDDNDHASFAHMLRMGKAKPNCAPVKPSWGAKASEPAQLATTANACDSDEDAPAPDYRVAFGDAIQEAINGMSLRSTGPNEKDKKGKRKKGKNTLLFTTSMNRSK